MALEKKNPFVYGRILRPDDPACARPVLEKAILRAFRERERLALYGDRRLGKSSLVSRTLGYANHACVVVDLLGLKSVEGFCAVIVGALEEYLRRRSVLARRITPWLREVGLDLRDIRLMLSRGAIQLEMSSAQSTDTLRRLLDRIGQLGERAPLAIFFDEFQEITDRLPAEDARHVLGVLRSMIQRQDKVAYFFAGSAKTSFTNLFLQEGSPFFEGAHLLEIEPISAGSFADFLSAQFARSGRPAARPAIDAILNLGGERSADIQQLAHESWYAAREGRVTTDVVARALLKIVSTSEAVGLALLSGATELQQRALFAVAFFQDGLQLQKDVVRIAGFRSAGAYRKALSPFMTGETPVLEGFRGGRVRFRHHYLRLWCVLQYSRAVNLLPVLGDADYYQKLLPENVRLILPRGLATLN